MSEDAVSSWLKAGICTWSAGDELSLSDSVRSISIASSRGPLGAVFWVFSLVGKTFVAGRVVDPVRPHRNQRSSSRMPVGEALVEVECAQLYWNARWSRTPVE